MRPEQPGPQAAVAAEPAPLDEQTPATVRHHRLADLAVDYHDQAVACAQAGCFLAASVMIGAALEAELLTPAIALEDDLKAAQQWPSTKNRPETWGLDDLVMLAISAGWFPAQLDAPGEDNVSQDDIQQMLAFVTEVRNLAAHPGRYVRTSPPHELDHDAYQTAHEILRTTFDYTYAVPAARTARTLNQPDEPRHRKRRGHQASGRQTTTTRPG